MATRNGKIKRVSLPKFAAVRPSGLIAINLQEGDFLGWVRLTSGDDEIILVTELGQALRFHEKNVRPMGRPAAGVKAINLRKGDFVTSMDIVDPEGDLLVVTENGYGKRTPLSEYPAKGRATGGVVSLSRTKRDLTGRISAARVVDEEDDLTLISSGGIVLRTKVSQVKVMGRSTMGVRVMNLKPGETVASVARISTKDLKQVGAE
jgi:DNA gyrase subunit A